MHTFVACLWRKHKLEDKYVKPKQLAIARKATRNIPITRLFIEHIDEDDDEEAQAAIVRYVEVSWFGYWPALTHVMLSVSALEYSVKACAYAYHRLYVTKIKVMFVC